jgi:branched-chain amino acid transport system permease protein
LRRLGLVFGALAIRRQGIYFAMITLALAQMVYFFSLQAPRFTGGEDGIQAVPRNNGLRRHSARQRHHRPIISSPVIFLAGVLLIYRIIHSPFGQVLKAIRDNEARAISLGYRVSQYKLAVFVLSATLAGLAGATKAIAVQLASLTDVHWSHVGRGRADDAGRRHGHRVRADRRRGRDHLHAELPRRAGAPG